MGLRGTSTEAVLWVASTRAPCSATRDWAAARGYRLAAIRRAKELLQGPGSRRGILVIRADLHPGRDPAICADARQAWGLNPMLYVSATEDEAVGALEAGADASCVADGDVRRIHAWLTALSRRVSGVPGPLTRGPLTMDPLRPLAWLHGKAIALTPCEHAVLRYLLSSRGVVSRSELAQRALDRSANPANLRYHMFQLRRKLGCAAKHLATVRGVGYAWSD